MERRGRHTTETIELFNAIWQSYGHLKYNKFKEFQIQSEKINQNRSKIRKKI
jgi:hypothetical protein